MRPSAMGVDIEFLRSHLEDEFSSTEGVRIQIVLPTSTSRSIDLHQDYDADSNDLHLRRGVRVIVKSRDYFFPAYWIAQKRMDLVYAQVAEMRAFLGK
ncbi:MAG: hypothetical protein JST04_04995 [Bdellovibrionales bacterium]|nr:hypothetical protein [Bdellovibrionales bacterium]